MGVGVPSWEFYQHLVLESSFGAVGLPRLEVQAVSELAKKRYRDVTRTIPP
jgi:hypothetical protein